MRLHIFKTHVQPSKQPYLDAICDEQLGVSDRIVSLDIAVGAMHIEFPISRSLSHQESVELRTALERARFADEDTVSEPENQDRLLCKGILAFPGQRMQRKSLMTTPT
jgi:hypothetical protein